jgi:hypothetical protein
MGQQQSTNETCQSGTMICSVWKEPQPMTRSRKPTVEKPLSYTLFETMVTAKVPRDSSPKFSQPTKSSSTLKKEPGMILVETFYFKETKQSTPAQMNSNAKV